MEKEYVISGYCRMLDGSRMVLLETDGPELLDVDCSYETCQFRDLCTIGKQITEHLKEE